MCVNDMVEFDVYQKEVDDRRQDKAIYQQNNLWYLLCMSLVKNREEVEEKAFKLASRHGLLKALRLQRKEEA